MAGEEDKYYFPETLNQQTRVLGLPVDELIIVAPLAILGVMYNMSTVLSIIAGLLWWLIRYLKKGQGSYWLLNFCYWHLPSLIFRVTFRRIPDSSFRHWRA
ncbi:type IV conjugative transfer system protein TraL [Cronobacter sakazakii]|jgi:conjugal transfer pilus assembly protein TraL|uniref:Protein TraL n=1 Tax=Franconibacter pulveris TaxID=435910 RepID=A0A0J8VNJ7_9ENTR|nr:MULTISPECIES: type IV conjugative transfer system protein TraL [Enterobacteriaceae]EGT4277885.1 type IV conjugative transfer system protein TraL [Cronobacter sakazakii]EGT5186017.1 type IV conjugative transfer system protein TraL [Cronobacter sakazakii]EGT5666950.1 type IV conjugative transfer system protein TraL [Cronobacter sakazakii]EGT5763984.1 type IV conjugative transfer system protein TraL [Cronobacter sakazakii]EGZ7002403.1 type IV conjugative transfer system protein TraL [Cronobact